MWRPRPFPFYQQEFDRRPPPVENVETATPAAPSEHPRTCPAPTGSSSTMGADEDNRLLPAGDAGAYTRCSAHPIRGCGWVGDRRWSGDTGRPLSELGRFEFVVRSMKERGGQ